MLAEVEDVTSCRTFADGGAVLTLAMFYLEGEFYISVEGNVALYSLYCSLI
jgi:hypothetical protein